jgi:ElaB/YqjD/DUF883 family membrane-anchored ribosome-binding protein
MTKTIAHRSRVSESGNGSSASHLRGLLSEAKTTISGVGPAAAHDVKALRDRLGESVTAVKARAKAVAKVARKKVSQADDAIRAKPYHAMAIAGGVGLVAGLVIARRRTAR